MLKSLHLGRGNGLPNAAVVVTSLDILYGVVLVNSLFSTTLIVKFDGVDGLKGSKEVVVAAEIRSPPVDYVIYVDGLFFMIHACLSHPLSGYLPLVGTY